MTELQISTSGRPMQASKWIPIQMLVDDEEIKDLFNQLGNFDIYSCGCLLQKGEGKITHQAFLESYHSYLSALKEGKIPQESAYAPAFSSILTASSDCIYAQHIHNDRTMLRASKPIIQLQSHEMDYSSADNKFRSMVFGADCILWGIQFSYPQLYENPETHEVEKVFENPKYVNTELFRILQRWTRENTIPAPFMVNGAKINGPMRLGKQCLSWINSHPQLKKKGILIA